MLELLRGTIDFFIIRVLSLLLLQPIKTAKTKNIINLEAIVFIMLN